MDGAENYMVQKVIFYMILKETRFCKQVNELPYLKNLSFEELHKNIIYTTHTHTYTGMHVTHIPQTV